MKIEWWFLETKKCQIQKMRYEACWSGQHEAMKRNNRSRFQELRDNEAGDKVSAAVQISRYWGDNNVSRYQLLLPLSRTTVAHCAWSVVAKYAGPNVSITGFSFGRRLTIDREEWSGLDLSTEFVVDVSRVH